MPTALKRICPGCDKIWTQEEIEKQECIRCGYPDNEEFNTDEYDNSYYPDEHY